MATRQSIERAELEETLRIHRHLRDRARMIRDGFPSLLKAIDKDLAALQARRATLVAEHDRCEIELAEREASIAALKKRISRLDEPVPTCLSSQRLTTREKLARKMREIAELEEQIKHEESKK